MSINTFLGSSYKLMDSKNFDEFMKELGVGLVTRKLANSISATVTLTKENDTFTFTTSSTFKNTSISFKLGEEFDEETMDGRRVKTIMTAEGNKLVQTQKGSPDCVITREFSDDHLTATMTVNDVTAVRKYDKV